MYHNPCSQHQVILILTQGSKLLFLCSTKGIFQVKSKCRMMNWIKKKEETSFQSSSDVAFDIFTNTNFMFWYLNVSIMWHLQMHFQPVISNIIRLVIILLEYICNIFSWQTKPLVNALTLKHTKCRICGKTIHLFYQKVHFILHLFCKCNSTHNSQGN